VGLRATIHLITPTAYDAAMLNDHENFQVSGQSVDLGKAWHAIHYLLTGDHKLTFLLTGKQILDVSEHCEVHSPDAIAALYEEHRGSSASDIIANFDAARFVKLGIYPDGWSSLSAEYVREWLEPFLVILKRGADCNHGFLVVIS
jgi:Domain of unknown function (DUF1877)